MKTFYLTLAFLIAIITTCYAQDNPNAQAIKESQAYCPGLFNPTKFHIEGFNPTNASWQGRVGGEGISGGGGKMGFNASTCGNWDMTFPTGPISAKAIDTARISDNSTPSTWIFYGMNGACGYDISPREESHKRFRIMRTGRDPLTHGRLSYVPENDPDTTFSRSIRLGNHCGGGKQAEELIYQFKVHPYNAILVLYYALSLEDARHDAILNPEFIIEVQLGTPTPSTITSDLNTYHYEPIGDKLFYSQPTPVPGEQLWPFMDGGPGTNGSLNNVFLPWNKVVINLGMYLNNPIRICIGTGDCAYSAHYSYSYIAGYCRPMKIIVDGCPIDTNHVSVADSDRVVSRLTAPSGLEDVSYTVDTGYKAYRWYRCKDPYILGDTIGLAQGNDSIWFDSIFEEIDSAWTSTYDTKITDFQMHDTIDGNDTLIFIPRRAFACVMTTYMNKSTVNGIREYPITSRLFADASNQKPQIELERLSLCDGSITLTSNSYSATPNYMLDDSIKWTFYQDSNYSSEDSITTLIGNHVVFNAPHAGSFYAKIHVPTIDTLCYAEKEIEIKALQNPEANIAISNDEPCLNEEVTLIDTSENISNRIWMFSDGTTSADSVISRTFSLTNDTVKLIVENEYMEILKDDTTNTRHCADTASKVIKVFTAPQLEISDDTIVCEGELTHITISIIDEEKNVDYSYEWYRHLNDDTENCIQTGNILQQIPDENAETSTYYVKITRLPQGCEAWDSIRVHVIKPTMKINPKNGSVCSGDKVQLIAGNAHHYSWYTNPIDTSLIGQETNDTIIVMPSETTTYTLIGHGSNNCNTNPITQTITIYNTPIPKIEISPKFIDSENPIITFNDISEFGVSSKWDFGDGETSRARQTAHTFTNISNKNMAKVYLTSYNPLGTYSEHCYASTFIDIPIQLFSVWIPNTFTPTEPTNNTFRIYTTNTLEYFSIQIYNRMGQTIFSSTDQNFNWDGTYNGILCPVDAYIYLIQYRREGTPNTITRNGTISLIK